MAPLLPLEAVAPLLAVHPRAAAVQGTNSADTSAATTAAAQSSRRGAGKRGRDGAAVAKKRAAKTSDVSLTNILIMYSYFLYPGAESFKFNQFCIFQIIACLNIMEARQTPLFLREGVSFFCYYVE